MPSKSVVESRHFEFAIQNFKEPFFYNKKRPTRSVRIGLHINSGK